MASGEGPLGNDFFIKVCESVRCQNTHLLTKLPKLGSAFSSKWSCVISSGRKTPPVATTGIFPGEAFALSGNSCLSGNLYKVTS